MSVHKQLEFFLLLLFFLRFSTCLKYVGSWLTWIFSENFFFFQWHNVVEFNAPLIRDHLKLCVLWKWSFSSPWSVKQIAKVRHSPIGPEDTVELCSWMFYEPFSICQCSSVNQKKKAKRKRIASVTMILTHQAIGVTNKMNGPPMKRFICLI